jgi:hypothetical protein
MRLSLVLAAVLAGTAAHAQSTLQREGTLDPRTNQKIEHLTTEDRDNRIDEIRVGGQTQSIKVQPKNSVMPGYEIQPNDMARSRPADGRDGFAERRPRVWNVFGF